ncbi:hypothetical protein IWW38_001295 [Coemansia aciculifera]|uniref:Uncharacterized protein n=1 Tax=Coemansia aciculifera TaxID=417176 RepID=A0ACC1M6R8_9FUNG|nr:hypothetical protein IWW38_001295 [Coemansia aciculifera]
MMFVFDHHRLAATASTEELEDWFLVMDEYMADGPAGFAYVSATLDSTLSKGYTNWCAKKESPQTWTTLSEYLRKEHSGCMSPWHNGYNLFALKATGSVSNFNSRFLYYAQKCDIADKDVAKGLYHAKLPPALSRLVWMMPCEATLDSIMIIVACDVAEHLTNCKTGGCKKAGMDDYGDFC